RSTSAIEAAGSPTFRFVSSFIVTGDVICHGFCRSVTRPLCRTSKEQDFCLPGCRSRRCTRCRRVLPHERGNGWSCDLSVWPERQSRKRRDCVGGRQGNLF